MELSREPLLKVNEQPIDDSLSSNSSESEHEWCGTWRQRNPNTKDQIGIMLAEGKLLALLLTHYDLIVYLGFSLWRKMIQHFVVKEDLDPEFPGLLEEMSLSQWGFGSTEDMGPDTEEIRNEHRASAGYLATVTSALPKEFLVVQKPVKMSELEIDGDNDGSLFSHFLMLAVKQEQADVVVILVKMLHVDTSEGWSCAIVYDGSLLRRAAIMDSGTILRHLLDLRPVDSFPLEERCCMLTYAAGFDAISSMTVILTHPSFAASTPDFINMMDEYGDTAISLAISNCSSRVVSLLIQHGVDLQNTNARYGSTPAQVCEDCFGSLSQCAAEGRLEAVQIMLDVGLHVDGVPNRTTPLHSAAEKKQTEMVRFLLQRGADPDGRPRLSDDDGDVENS